VLHASKLFCPKDVYHSAQLSTQHAATTATHLAVGCLEALISLLQGLIAFLHILIAHGPPLLLLLFLILTPALTL
jgi:hypothetical protein